MAASEPEDVYCTLVMSDAYLPGAAVLAHSLRDAGTKKKLACLATGESLRAETIRQLKSLYDYVIPIDRVGNPNPANLYLMNRPDLLYTFSKINLWRLTQFRKIVYLDSDVVALRAPDELFDTPEAFAAAPDVGWPDIFNTGVMVLAPSEGEYRGLRTMALSGDSFDGADQGLLNQYFEHRPWRRLSFTYNCTPSGSYQYEPAFRYFKSKISLVHFIGSEKPWQKGRNASGVAGGYQELLGRWWTVYDRHYQGGDMLGTRSGPAPPPEAAVGTTEPPMTEPTDAAEAIGQGLVHPESTRQQRKFSAPSMEWDATRAAPPSASKPEASNFPSTSYEFSRNRDLFRPPSRYPEPPGSKAWQEAAPPPIFPWEQRDRPQPTRKFAEDDVPPPPRHGSEDDDFAAADELTVSGGGDGDIVEPKTPTIKITDDTPWGDFGNVNRNAWDEVSGIDTYVRALTASQRNKGKVQVLSPSTSAITSPTSSGPGSARQDTGIMSSSNEPEPAELIDAIKNRRESIRLTDFPSADERPSLPVTPAPRRKQPTFWGEERDEEAMPMAEGVPDQVDWNPDVQLEQLRRNSLTVGDLKFPSKNSLPSRTMPSTAALIPEESSTVQQQPPPSQTAQASGMISGGATTHSLHSSTSSGQAGIEEPLSPRAKK